MVSWREFEQAAPEIAAGGRKLLFQYGVGSGYLATIRADGFPRIMHRAPRIEGDKLEFDCPPEIYADFARDRRYAFHTDGAEDTDDEFYITGSALGVSGAEFDLDIERALLSTYRPRSEGNTWPPRYEKWADPSLGPGDARREYGPAPQGVPWHELAATEPSLAELARQQIRFVGIGLGYLATVRRDGGPRIHPFCPTFSGDGLYGLITPSLKQRDLQRNPRCAIHACLFPASPNLVELTCVAVHRTDAALLEQVHASAAADGMTSSHDEELFEFHVVAMDITQSGGSPARRQWALSSAVVG